MIELKCEGNPIKLGIKTEEGVNITRFLDHLERCEKCSKAKEALMRKLNQMLGGETRN